MLPRLGKFTVCGVNGRYSGYAYQRLYSSNNNEFGYVKVFVLIDEEWHIFDTALSVRSARKMMLRHKSNVSPE